MGRHDDEPNNDQIVLSRRRLIALGGAGLVLAACGSDSSSSDGFTVVQRWPQSKALVPGPNRLAFSLADASGSLVTAGPDSVTGSVRDDRATVIAPIEAVRRGAGLGVPYWSIEVDVPARGLYDIRLDGAAGDPSPFLVWNPEELTVIARGSTLPGFDTPTTADARGVDPICTRLDGACPFHEVTLTEALAANKPVVYIVGTPAHCATATCGPGLDFLIDVAKQYASTATFVHAEVYADNAATTVAPAVAALGIDYEPVIFVTDATGTITRRIDIVWDEAELTSMLADALG